MHLSKNVESLIKSRNIFDLNILVGRLLSDEMKVHFDVLDLSVKDWIGSKCYGTHIITP
jgi:uncharacterized protein (UPF0210 family)